MNEKREGDTSKTIRKGERYEVRRQNKRGWQQWKGGGEKEGGERGRDEMLQGYQ